MTTTITIRRPDDWHLHLRDGDMLKTVLPYSSKHYARALVMPNLVPPLTKIRDVIAYRQRIIDELGQNSFTPLMTAYLTDNSDANDLVEGFKLGIITAAKLYPANATTNSTSGVSDINAITPLLDKMQEIGMPLLVHGESTDPTVDIFDREAHFIEHTLLPLTKQFPALKIVLEHVTTKEGADFVSSSGKNIAATVTPQHLLLNRNAMFNGGLRPHNYCLPVLKREQHRQALVKAVTSGSTQFFLGTDSAPHEKIKKESACGCAGAFNVQTALSLYAEVFEQENALDKLEGFCSIHGANFYKKPLNEERITLSKKAFKVPESIEVVGGGTLIPFMAGETLNWRVN